MSATTTQLLSSGEFCKLRYDSIPVKSAFANVYFYTNNWKIPSFELWHSCRKWAIYSNYSFIVISDCVCEKLEVPERILIQSNFTSLV